MSITRNKTSKTRQRILETAERLFYAEGVRAVGVDRIIAEAGVAKMSLYKHFPSKDELILEVLRYREEKLTSAFANWMEHHRNEGLEPVDAFFAALKDWFESPGFRGCMFINSHVELADVEHPASRFSSAHKERFHAMISGLIEETASKEIAALIAPAVAVLVEGAIVTATLEQSSRAVEVAREAAKSLLRHATA